MIINDYLLLICLLIFICLFMNAFDEIIYYKSIIDEIIYYKSIIDKKEQKTIFNHHYK